MTADTELTRKMVKRTLALEPDEMFGGTIDDLVSYLNRMRAGAPEGVVVTISQEWSGYEDNYFELVWETMETDDEFELRKNLHEWRLSREREERESKRRDLEKRRRELEAEQAALVKQLRKLS